MDLKRDFPFSLDFGYEEKYLAKMKCSQLQWESISDITLLVVNFNDLCIDFVGNIIFKYFLHYQI